MLIPKSIILIALICLIQCVFSGYLLVQYRVINSDKTSSTHIYFLDVGQGDASYIVAPNRNSLLIDAGPPNKKVVTELSKIESFFTKHIDVALGTHSDTDHVGSFLDVYNAYPFSSYIYNGITAGNSAYEYFLKTISHTYNGVNYNDHAHASDSAHSGDSISATQKIIGMSGVSIVLDKQTGTTFKIISPNLEDILLNYTECEDKNSVMSEKGVLAQASTPTSTSTKSKKNKTIKKARNGRQENCKKYLSVTTNDSSIVGILSYADHDAFKKILFTGDASIAIEKNLIRRASNDFRFAQALNIDVLKVGHHGSKTSTSEDFVRLTSPSYAIISSGKNNKYGHPDKEVLDILMKYLDKDHILRTDEQGTIQVLSDWFQMGKNALK